MQPDGKIVAAGGAGTFDQVPPPGASLAGFNVDGTLDQSYAAAGIGTTDHFPGGGRVPLLAANFDIAATFGGGGASVGV